MSLSYEKLDVLAVRDPRTMLDQKRDYIILKGGSQVTYKEFTTTAVSNSSMQFSCPPPSGGIIVDRKVMLMVPMRLTFYAATPVGTANLFNPGTDAPRAFPLSSMIDTLQININNQAVSIQMADVIQALMRFNGCTNLNEGDYSTTPAYQDQAQAYSQLYGSVRNPLSFYGDSKGWENTGRAGFPFTIVTNTPSMAVVDMIVTEPLFISPFYWGHSNSSGFFNVNTMDFNISFLNQAANRAWSHDDTSGFATKINGSLSNVQFTALTGFSYKETQPNLLFTYITPQETQIVPSMNTPLSYPYFDIQRYPTDTGSVLSPLSYVDINSNNIQLNSIPRRLYIFVRETNNTLYSTCVHPDVYWKINSISVQFQNKNGLLASANKRQLYEIAVKNHCKLNWAQWSGENIYQDGGLVNRINGVGSILCLEFATDIGLDSLDAPGKLGQYMLQIRVNAQNISPYSIQPTLYIVVVSEGTFTIEGLGKCSTNIGVISSQDILDSQNAQHINYKDVEDINGGNFLSGLLDFGKNVFNKVKGFDQGLKTIRQGIMGAIPGVARSFGIPVPDLPNLALGEGSMSGGAHMPRSSLKHRIQHHH